MPFFLILFPFLCFQTVLDSWFSGGGREGDLQDPVVFADFSVLFYLKEMNYRVTLFTPLLCVRSLCIKYFFIVVVQFPAYMTEFHGSPLKVALTHVSAIFLCSRLLPDFSFTIEENLLEIIMRGILYLFFLNLSPKK